MIYKYVLLFDYIFSLKYASALLEGEGRGELR